MRYFLRLGLKNVFRQHLRTALALGAIGLSVALIVIGSTFAGGMERYVFGEVLGELGEIVVARQDYFDKSRFNPLKYSMADAEALQERVLKVQGVRAAFGRIDFGFMAQAGETTEPIACTAVNLRQFLRYSKLPDKLVAGRLLQPGEKGLLIGKDVAHALHVQPGDTLTAIGKTAYDSFTADDFPVVGIFDLGAKMLNRTSFMDLGHAQEFLEMTDAVSKLLVFGPEPGQAQELSDRLAAELPQGATARPWTRDPLLGSIYVMGRAMRIALAAIICFVAGMGILNMMMVSVLERRREIGVLMALGMSHGRILVSFLYEALLYGLLGSALGILLGAPLALYLDRIGIDFRSDDIQGLPFAMPNTIHGHFGTDSLILGVATGVLLSLLGMLWPMLKTFAMKPHDAMARR